MFSPNSKVKRVWDLVLLLLTLLICIEIPLRVSLMKDSAWHTLAMEVLITFFFTIDIVLNFFTPYYTNHRLVVDRKQIAQHYLKGWFWVDLLAALPFALILGQGGFAHRAIRLAHFLHLNRILKVPHLAILLNRWRLSHMLKP